MAFVPFMSSECIALAPHVGFDLSSKLVRHAAARSLHGAERNQEQDGVMCLNDNREDGGWCGVTTPPRFH